jgi:hypothetical protein
MMGMCSHSEPFSGCEGHTPTTTGSYQRNNKNGRGKDRIIRDKVNLRVGWRDEPQPHILGLKAVLFWDYAWEGRWIIVWKVLNAIEIKETAEPDLRIKHESQCTYIFLWRHNVVVNASFSPICKWSYSYALYSIYNNTADFYTKSLLGGRPVGLIYIIY